MKIKNNNGKKNKIAKKLNMLKKKALIKSKKKNINTKGIKANII